MSTQTIDQYSAQPTSGWLKWYYFTRFAFSAAWVAVAFTLAKDAPLLAAIMLIGYPAWDALANATDAQHNGGLRRNKTQMLNLVVSGITAIAVAVALGHGLNRVLVVFGMWAGVAGVLQLATAVRRGKSNGAQWAMILSGAQSALAGFLFVRMAGGTEPVGIATVAPYAAFGAFYFFVAAIWLTVSDARKSTLHTAN